MKCPASSAVQSLCDGRHLRTWRLLLKHFPPPHLSVVLWIYSQLQQGDQTVALFVSMLDIEWAATDPRRRLFPRGAGEVNGTQTMPSEDPPPPRWDLPYTKSSVPCWECRSNIPISPSSTTQTSQVIFFFLKVRLHIQLGPHETLSWDLFLSFVHRLIVFSFRKFSTLSHRPNVVYHTT